MVPLISDHSKFSLFSLVFSFFDYFWCQTVFASSLIVFISKEYWVETNAHIGGAGLYSYSDNSDFTDTSWLASVWKWLQNGDLNPALVGVD